MKLFTIGLPVYNAMPYLPETIASILAQTYEDFELLIIDDGSSDGSLEFLRSLRDRRLTLISQENRGLTATLNRMLEETTTPWLVRQDADDIAFANRLSLTTEYVGLFPKAGLFYSYARFCQGNRIFGQFRTTTAPPGELRRLTEKGYLLAICHPSVTLNVEKTKLAGGYRFDLHVEDVDLWWRMALDYDIQLIPESTVACRHNFGSVSAKNFERQCVNTLFVQYLLLSHLGRQEPEPYDVVYPRLEKLLNRRQMQFRKNARAANVSISEGKYLSALGYAGSAFLSSPKHLLRRLLYEVLPKSDVVNGEDPELFAKQGAGLWPGQMEIETPLEVSTSSI